MLVAPHRESSSQLAAGERDVRPCRRRRELQQAKLLPVLLLTLLCLLVVECQLGVANDRDRRLRDSTAVLLVNEARAQLVGVALLVKLQLSRTICSLRYLTTDKISRSLKAASSSSFSSFSIVGLLLAASRSSM
ncbi:unnamed protein product [Closterium sp. NIES-54]